MLNSTVKLGRMKAFATDNSPAPETTYSFGLYALDPVNGTLTRDSVRVRMQEQPFRLLLLLVERAGQVVSREEIRNRLWPQNTFVEFDKSLGVAVLKVREALGDDASNPRFIETIPRRGYRFVAPVHLHDASPERGEPADANASDSLKWKKKLTRLALGVVLLASVVGAGFWFYVSKTTIPEHPTIVIGDFENDAGDPVFDGSLRRAVVIHLRQTPYLNVLPDERLRTALQSLGRSPDGEARHHADS